FLLFHSQTYTMGRKTTRIAFYGQQVLFALCRSRIGIAYTAFQPVLFIHEQDGTHCVFRTYTQGFESAYHFYRLYTACPVLGGTFAYLPCVEVAAHQSYPFRVFSTFYFTYYII